MDREINIINYLPPKIKNYKDYKAISDVENPEFNDLQESKNIVLNNTFIETANEIGIKRYEKMLKIYPKESDTLETRRFRVQSRWNNSLIASIIEKLQSLCGDDFSIEYIKGQFIINIETHIGTYGALEELTYILEKMIPCNIIINIKNKLKANAITTISLGGCNNDFRTYNLSCDFVENYELQTDEGVVSPIFSATTIYEIN